MGFDLQLQVLKEEAYIPLFDLFVLCVFGWDHYDIGIFTLFLKNYKLYEERNSVEKVTPLHHIVMQLINNAYYSKGIIFEVYFKTETSL